MKRRYQIIGAVALLGISFPRIACSQKVDLHDCEKPGGDKKITTFTVDLPIPAQRAQSRVLKVFTMLGLSPSAVGSTNQVEWDSGTQTNAWTGDNRRRKITATIMEGDVENTATVLIAPVESNSDQQNQKSMQALSNKNSGYGGEVWCTARAITDSLHSWADAQKALADAQKNVKVKSDSAPR